jgi:hypothetical protein
MFPFHVAVSINARGIRRANDRNYRENSPRKDSNPYNMWRLPHILPFVLLVLYQREQQPTGCCLVDSVSLLPISQSIHAHRAKSTELLNFDLIGSGSL